MRTLLAMALLTMSIASIKPAEACSPPPEGWNYRAHRSDYAEQTNEAIIIFRGDVYLPLTLDMIQQLVTVTVSHDGVEIPGALEVSAIHDTLIWRAEAPVDSNVEYAVTVTTKYDWSDETFDHDLRVQWSDAATEVGDLDFKAVTPKTFVQSIYGDCVENGWVDSCGGCEREIIKDEAHWSVEASIAIDREHNQFITGRIALGTTEDSALEALDEAKFKALIVEDAAHINISGGAQDNWEDDKACVAVEIAKFDGTSVFKGARCFDVPRSSVDETRGRPDTSEGTLGVPDVPETNTPDDEDNSEDQDISVGGGPDDAPTPITPNEMDDDTATPDAQPKNERPSYASGGGCSLTSTGSSEGSALIFAVLLLGLGRRNRR